MLQLVNTSRLAMLLFSTLPSSLSILYYAAVLKNAAAYKYITLSSLYFILCYWVEEATNIHDCNSNLISLSLDNPTSLLSFVIFPQANGNLHREIQAAVVGAEGDLPLLCGTRDRPGALSDAHGLCLPGLPQLQAHWGTEQPPHL